MISFHITLGKNFKEVTVSVHADVSGDVTCDTSVVHVSLYLFPLAFHHREKNWGEWMFFLKTNNYDFVILCVTILSFIPFHRKA